MTAVSIDDYLRGELSNEVRHEFVDGMVYATVGGTRNHSHVASRVIAALTRQLDGSSCVPIGSDFRIRIQQRKRTFFNCPDVSVFCGSASGTDVFGDDPVVIVEVLSDSTRRTDQGENRDNYLAIESRQNYIMMEQSEVTAVVYQWIPSREFEAAVYQGESAVIPMAAVEAELDLGDIDRGIVEAE